MGWVAKIKNFSKNRFASLVRTCLYLVTTFEVVTKYRQVRTVRTRTDKYRQVRTSTDKYGQVRTVRTRAYKASFTAAKSVK